MTLALLFACSSHDTDTDPAAAETLDTTLDTDAGRFHLVEAGTWTIGCTPSQIDVRLIDGSTCDAWGPRREVTLDAYWIAEFELTRAGVETIGDLPPAPGVGDDTPFLALPEDWPGLLDGTGYRLPTDAEWEVAARAGEDHTYAGSDRADRVAWTTSNTTNDQVHAVGILDPNAWGLYDMSGNAAELVADAYSRGGSYNAGPDYAAVSVRLPAESDPIGVRLAIDGSP